MDGFQSEGIMHEDVDNSSESNPQLPPSVSSEFASELATLDADELRAVIAYAQSLLPSQPAPEELIEPQPGEEILEITEHEGFTTVLKEQPCVEGCDDCPHGPYLYRVRAEIHLEEDEPALHWSFLGRVTSEDE